jgi:phosphate transport system permease protein
MRPVAGRRKVVSAVMTGTVGILSFVCVLPLLLIFGYLVVKGATSLNLAFFIENPVPAGQSGGGVANAIVGSILTTGLAALIGLPVGVGAGVFLAEYGQGRLGWIVRFVADVLNGTPSIIIGIFAWTWIVRRTGHFSGWAGAVALSVILVPVVARTTEEMVHLVPHSLREAALALGYPRWRASLSVVLRTALAGIVTGALVGVARIAGETAPLLFTAFNNRFWSVALDRPIASLPVQIYTNAVSPYDDWHRQAWAAALVLVAMVLVLNVAARLVVWARGGSR